MMIAERITDALPIEPSAHLTSANDGWYVSGNRGDTLFSAMYRPNYHNLPAAGLAAGVVLNSAGSRHAGGLHVLMADGSARFVAESVESWPFDPRTGVPIGLRQVQPEGWWSGQAEPGVWQDMATRAGGETSSP
jgi:prepilin-type processing-associated H-X9-DG protein